MGLRIELQTRQYHQNVQNFGAELLEQVLVQQKCAQGVTPPHAAAASVRPWGGTPPSAAAGSTKGRAGGKPQQQSSSSATKA